MRALVVDDSRVTRTILKQFMQRAQFEVHEAIDGQDGLVRLRAMEAPDLILVDWNMPVMNGLEFVQAVRADKTWEIVPIMMVTTENEMPQVVGALEAGANEFLMKPFTPDSLREKLELLGLPAACS